MNEKQRAFLDGASMAYKDCAKFCRDTGSKSPKEIEDFIKPLFETIAKSCEEKAKRVYSEAMLFDTATRQ